MKSYYSKSLVAAGILQARKAVVTKASYDPEAESNQRKLSLHIAYLEGREVSDIVYRDPEIIRTILREFKLRHPRDMLGKVVEVLIREGVVYGLRNNSNSMQP